jgi:hypothetical protein
MLYKPQGGKIDPPADFSVRVVLDSDLKNIRKHKGLLRCFTTAGWREDSM